MNLQDKELKDAVGQRKMAMAEYAEVTDKLSELRSQKQKLSRQVRDKEEELETAMQKIDSYRNDMRKADKSRREYESRIEDVIAEVTKVSSLLIVSIKQLLIVIFVSVGTQITRTIRGVLSSIAV